MYDTPCRALADRQSIEISYLCCRHATLASAARQVRFVADNMTTSYYAPSSYFTPSFHRGRISIGGGGGVSTVIKKKGGPRAAAPFILNRTQFLFEVDSIFFVFPLVCFGEPRSLTSRKYSKFCRNEGIIV